MNNLPASSWSSSRGTAQDGFFESYWRRAQAYLDRTVRRGISVWGRVGPDAEHRAVAELSADLEIGRWHEATATSSTSTPPTWVYAD